jgi:hypothetical protein
MLWLYLAIIIIIMRDAMHAIEGEKQIILCYAILCYAILCYVHTERADRPQKK